MGQDDVKIEDLIKIIKKRFKSIALIVILITSLAVILNYYLIPPLYRASTKVFVGKNDIEQSYNINDIQVYPKLLLTYAELIKTADLIESALEKNNINVDSKYVIENINAESKNETQILEISYVDSDKNLTKDILEVVTNEFILYSRELMPNEIIKIVEKVKVSNEPIRPRKGLNVILSFVLALMLSSGLAIILEIIDKSIKTKDDIEKLVNIPVIGVIPLESEKRKEKKNRCIVEKNKHSIESEAYRALKVNLQYILSKKKIEIIAVASGNYNEGKTTIAGNLALSFSQSNKQVLLIDCNLRKPTLHKLFNRENNLGLADVLLENVKFDEVIYKYNENVYILTAGHAINTASETLESVAMNELLETLKNRFDIVIVDTPEISCFTDTQVLAAKVDGVLVVVRAERTNRDSILEIKEKLDQAGGSILGIVLNGIKTSNRKYRY